MTDTCYICGRPAGRLYHRLEQTDEGVAHYVCFRDRERAQQKFERNNAHTN
mgnify:CR=1 FL=1